MARTLSAWSGRQVVFVAVALALASCRSCDPKSSVGPADSVALGAVVVKSTTSVTLGHDELRIDEGKLAVMIEAQLREAGLFTPPAPGAATATVTLEAEGFALGSAEAAEIGVKIHLRISVHPEGADKGRLGDDEAAIGQAPVAKLDAADGKASLQRLAERTTQDLVGAYVRRQKLWRADDREVDREVGAALASGDNELRVEALHVIGGRELHGLAAAVLLLLKDDDESVRDAALGALVALKERGAIRALADSHQMKDPREMGKVLDAIGSLGGREAEEYLGFVAETHDDEDIRGMAKEALERLHRREGTSRPTDRPTR